MLKDPSQWRFQRLAAQEFAPRSRRSSPSLKMTAFFRRGRVVLIRRAARFPGRRALPGQQPRDFVLEVERNLGLITGARLDDQARDRVGQARPSDPPALFSVFVDFRPRKITIGHCARRPQRGTRWQGSSLLLKWGGLGRPHKVENRLQYFPMREIDRDDFLRFDIARSERTPMWSTAGGACEARVSGSRSDPARSWLMRR